MTPTDTAGLDLMRAKALCNTAGCEWTDPGSETCFLELARAIRQADAAHSVQSVPVVAVERMLDLLWEIAVCSAVGPDDYEKIIETSPFYTEKTDE